ncbi:MAG: hypothetical protein KIT36_15150 [Alphaproteobacteria bacterium]|nr:hypothetical protein [Alphaproteobacteria bacterium]
MLEPLTYDGATLGESVGPFTYAIPADFNRKRLAALGIADASLLRDADGREYVEPSLLCGQHSWVMRQRFSWGGSVHAKCDIAYLGPVAPGATINVTARISGKYERRGGRYVVFQLQTTDARGDVVCRVENTMLLNFRDVITARRRERETATTAGAPTPSAAAAADAVPGLTLSFGPKPLRREDILQFFRAEEDVYGEHPSLHNVEAIARAAGLPDIIAPGRYSIGLMNCMFARLYGGRWLPGARYSVSFLRNLLPGIVASVQATPAVAAGASDAAGHRVFDVRCSDGTSGGLLLSGTASLPAGV